MNIDEIKELLQKISSPKVLSYKQNHDFVWDFCLQGRKEWNISLDFSFDFPNYLPSVKLLDKGMIGTLAHVNRKCTVCVQASDSLLIDKTRLSEVIEYFLEDIIKTLDYASLQINQVELTDEYEGYFEYDVKGHINSFYFATDKLENVCLHIVPVKSGHLYKQNHLYHAPVLLLDTKNNYPVDFSNVKQALSTVINIIHIPLENAVLPPSSADELTAHYIDFITGNISIKNKSKLEKKLEKIKPKKEFFLLISMPRRGLERTQLLLHYTSKKDLLHPLIEYSEQWDIETYALQRNNKEYLLERGGASNDLLNKKVVIVGCGSVGSEIAVMLAKAGVGEFTLIDFDNLKVDNIYRHRLGGRFLNYEPNLKEEGRVKPYSKVVALQFALQKDLPYIKVNPIKKSFDRVIDQENILNADLIIVAVGSPSYNLKLNTAFKERNVDKAVFCWNEAASYGGHSVSINYSECCLECLYTDDDGYSNICKLNFLEVNQNISKNLTGCAGVFTPFSYLDSSQTALLAANQSVQILLGQTNSSKSISWKGKDSGTLKTTSRYREIDLMSESDIFREEHCKVCNGN